MNHRWYWLVILSWLAFGTAILALVGCWWESNKAEQLSEHAHRVAEQVNRIDTRVHAVESSIRGYINTDNEAFLGDYYRSESKAKDIIESLGSLVFADYKQQDRVAQLKELVEQKFDWEHNLLSTYQHSGRTKAVSLSKTLTGLKLMEQISIVLHAIQSAENRLGSKYTNTSNFYKFVLLVGGGLLCIVGGITSWQAIRLQRLYFQLEEQRAQSLNLLETLYKELNRQVADLLQAQADANNALTVRSEFLAKVSHELRTPLAGVIGATELALEMPLLPKQRELIVTAKTSGETLLALVNDILDFESIELKGLHLVNATFNLRATIESALEPLTLKARAKGIELNLEIAQSVPDSVFADGLRVQQILVNLVDNAIKFTDRGNVSVTLSCETQNNEQAIVHFSITDTGVGISENQLSQIFDPFVQVDNSSTRRHGGSGLGLSICKKLVELLGGRIEVRSTPGQGSEFFFLIPFRLNSQVAPVVNDAPSEARNIDECLSVLVVDDNISARKITEAQLKRLGYDMALVASGQEAIESTRTTSYSLILMDVEMPGMDGLSATRIIRSMTDNLCRNIPIIALTADAMPGDRERCLAVGMSDYLAKPVMLASLREVLNKWAPNDHGISQDAASSSVSMCDTKRKSG